MGDVCIRTIIQRAQTEAHPTVPLSNPMMGLFSFWRIKQAFEVIMGVVKDIVGLLVAPNLNYQ
ncbi:unnamed protein product [Meloidogyne enterolobii]|uniref:Uncharacterized protein n=1 Tax=Meloidogyne enterolobii TaxID=390850 RepID=A0ACB0YZE7_MELEN